MSESCVNIRCSFLSFFLSFLVEFFISLERKIWSGFRDSRSLPISYVTRSNNLGRKIVFLDSAIYRAPSPSLSSPDFLQYFLKFEVTVAANDFPGNFFPRPRMNAFQLTAVLGSFVIEFRPDVPPPLLSVSKSRRAFDRGGFPYFATRVYTRHPFSRIIARVIPRFLLTGKFSTTNPLHPLGCLVPY